MELDAKDRELLSLLEKDPETSQSVIAEKIGVSQPSVSARIYKLKQRGVLSHIVGMNFRKVGLYLAKVDLTSSNTAEIIESFRNCPYFLNGLIVSGRHNLCLFFAGEDISTLEAIVDGHIRNDPHVKDAELSIVITPVADLILPVKMSFAKNNITPCKKSCTGCAYLESGRCLGCPVIDMYRGNLWKNRKTRKTLNPLK